MVANNQIRIEQDVFKFNESRPIEGRIKTVTVKQDAVNDLYICFAVEVEDVTPNRVMTGEMAGFDFGVKTFLIGSNGTVIESHLETLNLKAMHKMWGRKISDYGFAEFVTILKYQAANYRCQLIFIDCWFTSSKTCSQCGGIQDALTLEYRARSNTVNGIAPIAERIMIVTETRLSIS